MPPVLRGERVVLRPAGERDTASFAAILSEPGVARWFGGEKVALNRARSRSRGASGARSTAARIPPMSWLLKWR